MSLPGKVVVVTGASSGIGAALADELARRGALPVIAARRTEALQTVARRTGALAVTADVTRRQDVARVLDAALERHGRVDIWVNNAGHGISRSVADLTDEDVETMFRDNFSSALYGMQAVLPHFKHRGEGVLVNVSSMLSRAPHAPQRSAYSAAKAALNSITESLRLELRESFPRIRFVVVLPGVVATDFGNQALGGGPDSRQLPGAQDVTEVARFVADGLEAGALDIYTRPEGLESVLQYLRQLAQRPERQS